MVVVVISVFALDAPRSVGQEAGKGPAFRLSSPVFEHNGRIPQKYACDGANVNLPLRMENVPKGTQSLALILDDIDAPRGTYVHWILWNIDPGVKEMKENSVPEGTVQGTNDFKKQNYGGPCPPTRPHRYLVKVYALDTRLNLESTSGKTDLEKAMKGHILAEAQIMGTYQKQKSASKK